MVAEASIAAAAVASIAAAEAIMAEVMATTAHQSLWVRAAGGIPTASAFAGGDLGSIAVRCDRNKDSGALENRRAFFFLADRLRSAMRGDRSRLACEPR
jgi:hypothetical protein